MHHPLKSSERAVIFWNILNQPIIESDRSGLCDRFPQHKFEVGTGHRRTKNDPNHPTQTHWCTRANRQHDALVITVNSSHVARWAHTVECYVLKVYTKTEKHICRDQSNLILKSQVQLCVPLTARVKYLPHQRRLFEIAVAVYLHDFCLSVSTGRMLFVHQGDFKALVAELLVQYGLFEETRRSRQGPFCSFPASQVWRLPSLFTMYGRLSALLAISSTIANSFRNAIFFSCRISQATPGTSGCVLGESHGVPQSGE